MATSKKAQKQHEAIARYREYEKQYQKLWDEGYYMRKKMTFEEYQAEYKRLKKERNEELEAAKRIGIKAKGESIAKKIRDKQTSVYSKSHMGQLVSDFRAAFNELDEEDQTQLLADYPEIEEVVKGDTISEKLIAQLRKEDYWNHELRWQMFDLNEKGIFKWSVTSPHEE